MAKSSGETLAEHTVRCLKIAEILSGNLPFDEDSIEKIRKDLYIALAVHDVGKAAAGFQRSLTKGMPRWGHRHEIISASFGASLGLSEEAIMAVLTHHKSLPADGVTSDKGCLPREEIPLPDDLTHVWNKMADEWTENLAEFVKEWQKICSAIGQDNLSSFGKLIPLTIQKNWIRRTKQSQAIPYEKRYYACLLRGLLISSDHIASNNDINSEYLPAKIPILKQFHLGNETLRGFQKKAGSVEGSLILRAPTGSGKTLAALLWAQKNQKKNGRLFYALPNIASINAMYLRLARYFNSGNVGLMHSRAASSLYSLYESDNDLVSRLTNQQIARTLGSIVREMWFPIRVCTPHQVLRYSLHGKGWEAMFSEFPNSCFIFDEIHAYDPSITGLTIATARYLAAQNASCLFLSATLPEFLRRLLTDQLPSISFLEPSKMDEGDKLILEQKRHAVEIIDGNALSNIDALAKDSATATSTLIVCNHVQSAQQIYEELSKILDGVVLLHSQFCKRDRNRIEQKITNSIPKVLVSTQVVEVSLDIDFEQGFSEPAPIDALVQRFGRINRFAKRPPAKVRVFSEQLHSYSIYDNNLVARSLQELSSLRNPISEEDIRIAADRVYATGYDADDNVLYESALNHPLIKNFQDNLVAGIHKDWVEEVIESSDGTIELLPLSLLDEFQNKEKEGLYIEANDLLVEVRLRKLFWLRPYIDTHHDPWLVSLPYSEKTGLASKPDVEDNFI